jgi:hypothetical protein
VYVQIQKRSKCCFVVSLLFMASTVAALTVLALAGPSHAASRSGADVATWADLAAAVATSGTYTLAPAFSMDGFSRGQGIGIYVDVTILGQGVVLDAKEAGAFFVIGASLTLKNLTLQNGYFDYHQGGAVYNEGTLTASDCHFSGNNAYIDGNGGAVWNSGTFTATDCHFSRNGASRSPAFPQPAGRGGAVYNSGPGAKTTFYGGWTFTNNTADMGPDVYNEGAVVFVTCAGKQEPMGDCCTVPAPTPPCPTPVE